MRPSVLIAYASISGNTLEVARLISEDMQRRGFRSTLYDIGGPVPLPDISEYDAILIGTYTWDVGMTPAAVKDFVADIGNKPPNVFIFGTGDTQFGGDDLFCAAADKLAKFYESPLPPLKIEQSPRGTQESEVIEWTKGVIDWLRD
ncbi:flavodoxin [Terribacillus sp. 179-K 1B1 HS]|uniref:flavodoxin n=1 Tax=Terribacillus sp. 179-K 1B1 HS TaxID=3142388 RepID=UPI00399FCF48